MDIRLDDLSGAQTRDLLRIHLAGMHANTPAGHVFALDLSGLSRPDVTVWSAWEGDAICGIGALKALGSTQGEVKSMRTHPDALRRGAGAAILEQIITEARARGYSRLYLETGTAPSFEPALSLYRKRGFVSSAPFGDYEVSAFNQFFHLDLVQGG